MCFSRPTSSRSRSHIYQNGRRSPFHSRTSRTRCPKAADVASRQSSRRWMARADRASWRQSWDPVAPASRRLWIFWLATSKCVCVHRTKFIDSIKIRILQYTRLDDLFLRNCPGIERRTSAARSTSTARSATCGASASCRATSCRTTGWCRICRCARPWWCRPIWSWAATWRCRPRRLWSRRSWRRWVWSSRPTQRRCTCPAVNGSGCRSHWSWSTIRRWCSSTSRPAVWIARRASSWSRCSSRWRAVAERLCARSISRRRGCLRCLTICTCWLRASACTKVASRDWCRIWGRWATSARAITIRPITVS